MAKQSTAGEQTNLETPDYNQVLSGVVELLEQARRAAARSVNAVMTATYWEIGRRIIEVEQGGDERAKYGENLLKRLSQDLTAKFNRGFSVDNLETMRLFYLTYSIVQNSETVSRNFDFETLAKKFVLSWSHYVLLIKNTKSVDAREFYETEALRGGWSVRQLKRQVESKFFERTLLSKNKAALLAKEQQTQSEDFVTPEEEIKDPFVLEFLGLKDEYSESDLEEAILKHLETFLLELGADFTFVGRQKRLRVGDEWYRVDLIFYHRRLRCLVIIDLKLGKLTHADIGQMLLYVGYADKEWRLENENPPIGLILCDQKNDALAYYTLDNLPNKILAAEYRTLLPDENLLIEEIKRTRQALLNR